MEREVTVSAMFLYCSVCGTYGIWNPESRMRYSQLVQMSPVGAYCIVLSFFFISRSLIRITIIISS